jgi:hypothetical protein
LRSASRQGGSYSVDIPLESHESPAFRLYERTMDGTRVYLATAILSSGVAELNGRLYPNPAGKLATIILGQTAGEVHFTLFDAAGRVLRRWTQAEAETSHEVQIDLSALPSGSYSVLASDGVSTQRYSIIHFSE